jgi:hypothetical protein
VGERSFETKPPREDRVSAFGGHPRVKAGKKVLVRYALDHPQSAETDAIQDPLAGGIVLTAFGLLVGTMMLPTFRRRIHYWAKPLRS